MQDELGTCNTRRHTVVASAFHHFGEEDCPRGWNGSGTIFFALCNLRCVFCQNWDISQQRDGREMTAADIAAVMLRLQHESCHNVNFVTPEHVVPQVVEAIACAIPRGLNLPIVYNTSAYDSVESLRLMEGLFDIYMPDFKFWDPGTARSLARAAERSPRIVDAGWGHITVEGAGRCRDAKVWPGGGRAWDWNETGTRHHPGIQPADVQELLDHKPDVVVLSRGRQLRLNTCPETLALLGERGVRVEQCETGLAIELYNRLVEAGTAAAALLHSTC
jgi:hypothetical protein